MKNIVEFDLVTMEGIVLEPEHIPPHQIKPTKALKKEAESQLPPDIKAASYMDYEDTPDLNVSPHPNSGKKSKKNKQSDEK